MTKKLYTFSVAISQVEAYSSEEAYDKANILIENGNYSVEIVDVEEIEDEQ